MKNLILRIGTFLHIIDDDGRLDLSDIAFMIIMGKIVMSPMLDFPSVITLATVILNKMHKRSSDNTAMQDQKDTSEMIQKQTIQLKDLQDKLAPIVEKVKGLI